MVSLAFIYLFAFKHVSAFMVFDFKYINLEYFFKLFGKKFLDLF